VHNDILDAYGEGGNDTFIFNVTDADNDDTLDNDGTNLRIRDMETGETLVFQDGDGTPLTEAALDITDTGNNVRIQIDTEGTGDGSRTVVLVGVGAGADIASVTDLEDAGYNIEFT
jgi:hypothetical protein